MSDRYFNEQAKQRQSAQLKAEREEQARKRRLEAQREAAKQKPHASSFTDELSDRIIRRAERHAKALRQIQAGNYAVKPKTTATDRWRATVDALAAKMPKAQAIIAADRQNPGLREKMLAEVNSKSKR